MHSFLENAANMWEIKYFLISSKDLIFKFVMRSWKRRKLLNVFIFAGTTSFQVDPIEDKLGQCGIQEEMHETHKRATFSTLLKGLYLDNKLVEAEKLFKILLLEKLCDPNESWFIFLIVAGHSFISCHLLLALENICYKLGGFSYNASFNGFSKQSMVDDAPAFIKMINKDVKPTVVEHSSMIHDLYCDGLVLWK